MKRLFALFVLVAATVLPATFAAADPTSDVSPESIALVEEASGSSDAPSGEWLVWGCFEGRKFRADIGPLGWYGIIVDDHRCGVTNFIRLQG